MEVDDRERLRLPVRESCAVASASLVYPPLLNWAEVGKTLVQVKKCDGVRADFFRSSANLVRERGWARLFLVGLDTSLVREVAYNTTRWALYGAARERFGGRDQLGYGARFGLALSCGGLGSLLANPFDLIRVRQHAAAKDSFLYGASELARFLAEQRAVGRGPSALWRGWQVNAARSACFTGGSMLTYEETKAMLQRNGMEEGPVQHTVAGFCMGLVGTLCYMPADSVRTVIYNQRASAGKAPESITSVIAGLYANGGILAFFKGTPGAALRTVPACMIFPGVMEQSRKLWGLEYF